jgi:hypothetical protein
LREAHLAFLLQWILNGQSDGGQWTHMLPKVEIAA